MIRWLSAARCSPSRTDRRLDVATGHIRLFPGQAFCLRKKIPGPSTTLRRKTPERPAYPQIGAIMVIIRWEGDCGNRNGHPVVAFPFHGTGTRKSIAYADLG